MPLSPKLFSWSDRLLKSVFKGKPNLLTAQDINRYFDVLREYQTLESSMVGAFRDNFSIEIDPDEPLNSSQDTVFHFKYRVVKNNLALESGVFYKGVRFDVPLSSWVDAQFPVNYEAVEKVYLGNCYFVIVAKKKAVTFNSLPPVMHVTDPKKFSGVSGSTIPIDIPSADNIIYGEERLVVTHDYNGIALTTDESIVCILATLQPIFVPAIVQNSVGVDSLYNIELFYNAVNVKDLISQMPNDFRPSNNPEIPFIGVSMPITNGSMVEYAAYTYKRFKDRFTINDFALLTIKERVLQIIDSLTTLFTFRAFETPRIESLMAEDELHTVGDVTTGLGTTFLNGVTPHSNTVIQYVGESGVATILQVNEPSLCFTKVSRLCAQLSGAFNVTAAMQGGTPTLIMILPVGYRPVSKVTFMCEDGTLARLTPSGTILPNGHVVINFCSANTTIVNVHTTFKTA
jgi:hypothetical protein